MILRIARKDYKEVNWFDFRAVKLTRKYLHITPRRAGVVRLGPRRKK